MKKRHLFLLVALLLVTGVPAAFAQARGAFSIVCNVTGAKVYLNGELAGYTKPTFSALLKPAAYSVKVAMDKYQTFETTINMTANPLNLTVNLLPVGAVQQVGRFTLTVSANVAGAQVFVNNALVGSTPLNMQVERGNYSIRVTAAGYQDYVASVNVTGNSAVNAILQQGMLQLTVNCNVIGAQVYVNNALVGTAPFNGTFSPGAYTVRVSAPGYGEATTVVNLARNETVNLELQMSRLALSVNCNVIGAQVYVNNNLVGTTPFNGSFPPGSYAVRVTAPGYSEANTVVNLNRNETLSISLQASQVSVQISIPPAFLDPQNRNALAQVKVFIDGQFYNGFNFSLPAGRHNIRISSGGLSFAADYDFAAGRNYVVEPAFNWNVR